MGFVCLQSAVFALLIPETNGQPTLESMNDMERKKGNLLLTNLDENSATNNKRVLAEIYLDDLK